MKSLRSAFLALAFVTPLAATAATPESAPVAALDTALLTTMKAAAAGASFTARYAALDPVVRQSYDLSLVEQNSIGFLWSTIPAAQQSQLNRLFEQFTVANYLSQFTSNGGTQFQLLPAEKDLGTKKIVETKIIPADGSAPVEIDYVVANGPQGWQITDVLLDGTISQVAIHASDFSSLVTAGDASQLIAALKAKVASLSGGAMDSSSS